MDKENKNIIWFKDLGIEDVPIVGGKNAALGEMFANLTKLGINVPNGFAITARAYNEFLDKAGIRADMEKILKDLDTGNMRALQKAGKKVRKLILKSKLPKDLVWQSRMWRCARPLPPRTCPIPVLPASRRPI